MLNKTFFSLFVFFLFSTSFFAQDVFVSGSNGRDGYYRTSPNDTVNDNFSTKGNINPYTGKAGTKPRQAESVKPETGAYGTGEYFLVPAIVRKDPNGTAIRFNTCGTALMQLFDKGTIYGLTDKSVQYFTPTIVLNTAEDRFRIAIQFDDGNYVYFANLAAVLYRQRKFDEALENILKALELNPNDPILQKYEQTIRREKVIVTISDDDAK